MKKLLFTGASGFLGYNIRPLLETSYDVHTIGLTDDDNIKINMANEVPPINIHYDVVLHAAGKAHTVPKTEAEKQVFYDVNYIGTIHLCDALEKAGIPKAFIFISTVAVYGCEFGENIDVSFWRLFIVGAKGLYRIYHIVYETNREEKIFLTYKFI